MAIMLASKAKNINLIGISTVFGNKGLENTTNNALRVLKLIGEKNIEVYKGSE